MRNTLTCLCLIAFSVSSVSADSSITFYRDGALILQEAGAAKGTIDIPLAAGLVDHTLTITPFPGTTILTVEPYTKDPETTVDKELTALIEQRRRLEDRLQALETREAIFTAAAKAQSGKAPRKTKANPDPMRAIRQGTDFAIAQLEAVYTARRRTAHETRSIDARLAHARRNNRSAEHAVRIVVIPLRGKVTLRYATTERGWQPRYNLQLGSEGSCRLELSARITGNGRGYRVRVSPGTLAGIEQAETMPVRPGRTVLASYLLPIAEERQPEGLFNRFVATITNATPHYLPPGESGLYRNGTYLGSFIFDGLSSGRSRAVSLRK
jgi:hypothetical protein